MTALYCSEFTALYLTQSMLTLHLVVSITIEIAVLFSFDLLVEKWVLVIVKTVGLYID